MGVIEKTVEAITTLDAAGWAIIALRCDSESDIRRSVEGYVHGDPYHAKTKTKGDPSEKVKYKNIHETTAMGTVKKLWQPFTWNVCGPKAFDMKIDHGKEPALMECLTRCASSMQHELLYIPYLSDIIGSPGRKRSNIEMQYLYLMRDIGLKKKQGLSNALIIVGCMDGVVFPELREYTYILDIDYPDKEEILKTIRAACEECAGGASNLEPHVANELAEVLRGLRNDEITGIINLAYAQSEDPLRNKAASLHKAAKKAKEQRIAGVKGLKWINTDSAGEVGGLIELQSWLTKKSKTFLFPHAALLQKASAPKGVLLAGLPGCGKTHLAKYTSRLLSGGKDSSASTVPLLQLDLNSMLGKWLGEAEANCTMALRAVEGVAPCVLLVDEIEKVFGNVTEGGSNQAMSHIFATLLDWMQAEREKPILVIATANKTESLPPELKRKGRFDETFFTGIPTLSDCKAIFKIHLKRKASVIDCGMMNIEEVIEDISREFFRVATSEKRFLNGADIETIINAAFCALFFELKDISELEADNAKPKKYKIGKIKEALKEELEATRSYFDNNIEGVAKYWVQMYYLNFRDANKDTLLVKKDYDFEMGIFRNAGIDEDKDEAYYKKNYERETTELAESAAKAASENQNYDEGNYDRAFKYTLMCEIFRQVKK